MPRIDEMPEYRARHGRTTHDLSHKFGFTASVAHLLPVFHDFLQPGETVDLSFKYNLRTQPLASAAMVDINSHVEYFFVPINLLYEPFGNYFYDINDSYSSNYIYRNMSLPVLDFNDMVDEALTDLTVVYGFDHRVAHQYRLLDMLGYNVEDYSNGSGGNGIWNPSVFPYPILTYNCIYQYYYRLDTRETFNQNAFNWDKFYNTLTVDHTTWDEKYLRLYYRPKQSDYFTDIKVSPIVDVLNSNVTSSLPVVNDWLTRSFQIIGGSPVLKSGDIGVPGNGVSNGPDYYASSPSSKIITQFGFSAQDYSNSTSGVNTLNGNDINTANIRALFANEKLWSITGRAKKHYDDQVLAHLGFSVPHDPKHEISCFGHDRGNIHIGEVISTADTANAGLGEIAGKGYGSLSAGSHKFTAPCHGVIMAVLSFEPVLTYGHTYLKANALAKNTDLPIPEYYYLGMQPLFGYEVRPNLAANRGDILGWQYRYEQWKRRYHRVSTAFTGVGSLDSWMLDFRPDNTVNAAATENYLGFLHKPNELDQIMLVNYSDNVGAQPEKVYDGDPFVVDGYVYCKKVSSMPDFSLPRLDA